jgi:hypothetical protein
MKKPDLCRSGFSPPVAHGNKLYVIHLMTNFTLLPYKFLQGRKANNCQKSRENFTPISRGLISTS